MALKRAYIEITNICNLSCSFCKKTKHPQCSMDVKAFAHVLASLKPYTDYVYLHVLGEPLLHENLAEFLNICSSMQMKASITTNASLLRERGHCIKNKPALRLVNYSLHSIFQRQISVDTAMEEVFNFIENCSPHVYHCMRLWNYKKGISVENDGLLCSIEEHFKQSIPQALTKGNGLPLSKHVFLQLDEQFIWPDITAPKTRKTGKCYALKDQIAILADGTVVPCCLDAEGRMYLGNILKQPLSEILESPRAKAIKQGFQNRKLVEDLCQTCGFLDRLNQK